MTERVACHQFSMTTWVSGLWLEFSRMRTLQLHPICQSDLCARCPGLSFFSTFEQAWLLCKLILQIPEHRVVFVTSFSE